MLTKVKSLKYNEPISFFKSQSDLAQWIAPHFCTSVKKQLQ